jgi:hypothetical protein
VQVLQQLLTVAPALVQLQQLVPHQVSLPSFGNIKLDK